MAEINVQFEGSCNLAPSSKRLFIIDCDAGIDDALGILLALNSKLGSNIDVLGITCVGGNTTLENVVKNVLVTLKIAQREEVPVYKGAVCGVIRSDPGPISKIHTKDGLGGVTEKIPIDDASVQAVSKRPNAVTWLGETIMNHPAGSITLVTLGPMTNIGFAHRLYPEIHSRLERLVVMGGLLDARGNLGLTSEFNFGCDPEAAQTVLNEFVCPITIIGFDVCVHHYFPFEWYNRTVTSTNSIKANFVHSMFQVKHEYINNEGWKYGQKGFYACDWLAMVCALEIPGAVLESIHHYGTVELNGAMTRGEFVVDWRDRLSNGDGKKRKHEIITKLDIEILKKVFEQMLL